MSGIGNGHSREDQKKIGDKLVALLQKDVNIKFGKQYQAPKEGKVATMVIFCYSKKFKGEAVSYLSKHFGIDEEKILNHGSTSKTIRIQLSEVSKESIRAIEDKYLSFFPYGHKYTKTAIFALHEKTEAEIISEVNTVPATNIKSIINPNPETIMEKRDSIRFGFSHYLSSFLCSEKKILNPVPANDRCKLKDFLVYGQKGNTGNSYSLNCKDESIAYLVEKAIDFRLGSMSFVREGLEVVVDLSGWKDREKLTNVANFSLPPNENSTEREIERRLIRVSGWNKPVSVVKDRELDGLFVVKYHKKTTAYVLYDILSKMGWSVGQGDLGELFIYVYDNVDKLKSAIFGSSREEPSILERPLLESIPSANKPAAATSLDQSENQTSEVGTNHVSAYVFPGLPIGFIEKTKTKEEVYMELEELYNDRVFFSKLNEEIQLRIVTVLQEGYRDMHPNDYAEMLLEFYR